MSKYEPHNENAAGDFYVESPCCTMCGVPFKAAPELFAESKKGYGGSTHCYVKRQPANAAELDHMIDAISWAELGCIRYKGQEQAIQQRLVQLGEAGQCDELLPQYKEWLSQPEESGSGHKTETRRRSWWRRLSSWLIRKHRA